MEHGLTIIKIAIGIEIGTVTTSRKKYYIIINTAGKDIASGIMERYFDTYQEKNNTNVKVYMDKVTT